MPAPKKLTIGVSVNLQRYENLRLAVEGEVATDEDAEDLALYLDRVLARFGRNDPETALQIDRYRQRVMPVSGAGGEPEAELAPVPGPSGEESADVTPAASISPAGPAGAPAYLSRREGGAQSGAASAHAKVSGTPAGAGPAEAAGSSASPKVSPPSAPPASSVSAPAAPPAPPTGAKGVPTPPAADDHGSCEACGAALSRQEAKLSRLFVDRLLCKKCLDALQK